MRYGVKTFTKRVFTPLDFNPDEVIDGSLENATRAIVNGVRFVEYLANQKENTCPIQLDLILGYRRKISKNQNDDNKDDGDDEDDPDDEEDDIENDPNAAEQTDVIRDIRQRLSDNNLPFYEDTSWRRGIDLYNSVFEG